MQDTICLYSKATFIGAFSVTSFLIQQRIHHVYLHNYEKIDQWAKLRQSQGRDKSSEPTCELLSLLLSSQTLYYYHYHWKTTAQLFIIFVEEGESSALHVKEIQTKQRRYTWFDCVYPHCKIYTVCVRVIVSPYILNLRAYVQHYSTQKLQWTECLNGKSIQLPL